MVSPLHEGFIFTKLRIGEVSGEWNHREKYAKFRKNKTAKISEFTVYLTSSQFKVDSTNSRYLV